MTTPSLDTTPEPGARVDALAHELLTAHDETVLAQRMEAGLFAAHLLEGPGRCEWADAEELAWLVEDGQEARRAFIESNLRLAYSVARKFRTRGYTEDDVNQDAYHGLVKAVDRFDFTKGFKFSTYAVWWIRESVLSGIRGAGFIKQPEVLWNQINKVNATRWRLLDETGQAPTTRDLSMQTGLTAREVARCLHEDRPVTSLHLPVGENLTLGEVVCDEEAHQELGAVEDSFDRDRLGHTLRELLSSLDEDQAAVLVARFGLDGGRPQPIAAVAEQMGVNRQTVRLREQRAMQDLRQAHVLGLLDTFRVPGS